MKHLKLFEELNPETYASADSKLKEKGHNRRSKELLDYSVKMSKGTIDRIDPNDYDIFFSCDYFEIDGTYKITECQEDEDGESVRVFVRIRPPTSSEMEGKACISVLLCISFRMHFFI